MRLKRLLLPAALGMAVYFAVFGGEHSLRDLRRASQDLKAESGDLQALRQEIDSLRAWADSLDTDAAVLERLARERYGMIREGEVLYRFAEPPDSAATERDSTTR